MKKIRIINGKKYLSVIEFAKQSCLPESKVRKNAKEELYDDYIHENGHYYICESELNTINYQKQDTTKYKQLANEKAKGNSEVYKPFGDIQLKFDESVKFFDGIGCINFATFKNIDVPLDRIGVSNLGRIFNIDKKIELTTSKAAHGYLQVSIRLGCNKNMILLVQQVVALMFCPNANFYYYVHHINGNNADNRASNLIWVSLELHTECHRLLKKAKETGDYKEYNKKIREIKKSNKWKKAFKAFIAPDVGSGSWCYWVTEKAYNDYISGAIDYRTMTSKECIAYRFYINEGEKAERRLRELEIEKN